MNMRQRFKGFKRSKDGSMPFVAIAAVLLILASAYGVMISQSKDIKDTADNIAFELGSLDSAERDTEIFVERGLGELIFSISTDPEGGSLDDRAETFRKRSDAWMRSTFPSTDKGITVSVRDFDFVLEAEALKMTSADVFTDGFTPSYLKATGHYTANFVSGSGTMMRTTEISTDGTCALPLAAEQGSLFEIMVSEEGSALSQMMTHQLTALAQYRVLNGYGALAEYGSMGTSSILTTDDVKAAYDSSVKVLCLLVFRCAPDGLDTALEKADIADWFISKDGFIEIDLSAVYSQALISIMDDLVLKWFDYLYGNLYLSIADFYMDNLNNCWDSLKGFFSGKNEFSAAPYIERVMADNGLDISMYRYLFSGKTASIRTQGIESTIGGRSITIPSMTLSPSYPSVDLMSCREVSKFKSDYREDTNEIREWLRNVINTAAVSVGTSKALGTVRVPVDPSDDESFMESVYKTVDTALKNGNSEVDRIMTSAIKEQKISDPFYSAIFKAISENSGKIYGTDSFRENIGSSVVSGLTSYLENSGIGFDSSDIAKTADIILNGNEVKEAVTQYESAVNECLDGLRALAEVRAGKSGTLKDICTAIFKTGVFAVDIATDVPTRIRTLCSEAIENTDINAYSGPIELPGTDSFRLTGSDGNTSVEKLSFSSVSSPKVYVKGPNDNLSDCVHYTGFNDNTGASYATAFSVRVEDRLDYTVKSSGVLESAMGVSDSVFKGSSEICMDLKIIVASGWGLAGVKNDAASNTLLVDVWNTLIKLLSPILEPLRKVMSMISDALSILGSALIELSKYVAKIIEKLYQILMEPLEMLRKFIEDKLDQFFNAVLEKAVDAVEWIVGIDMSKQTVGFSFMGFTITFTTKLATLASNTKTLLTVAMSCVIHKVHISGSVTIKQRGSGASKELFLTGNAEIDGGSWKVSAEIDPLMKSTNHLITMNGYVRGVEFDIILPDLVQYQHADFTLSDIPALGLMLSNIPLPIPGLKASIDAGIDLKYNIPFETGILINEFELNPPGEDKDHEWVEILNATKSRADLDGYTLRASSDPKTKVYTIKGLSLAPGQREVIDLPGSFLNNTGSSLLSGGECVILRSPDGEEVDRTPAKKDSANDSRTWQRVADGAMDWTLAEGTPGTSNCGGVFGGEMVKAQIIKILKDSAVKTMGKMKSLNSTDDLSKFFKVAIHDAMDTGIEMLAACLVEAAIFVSIDITDATSTACAGVRLALFIDSGFIEEGLKYLVGEIESILLNIENPYGLRPIEVLTDNLYLGVTVYMGLSAPKFLKNIESLPKVKLGIHISCNVSALCRLIGSDTGKWKVTAGVIIMDCPSQILPSSMKADPRLDSDLWLLRATFHAV
ncbi:MAG: lamin tail domain-containing protein [Candidatus Methanoplasma sp.]|jgi:hypothetical protein|nr:lamin tail domain-containing protein [Candidatus Methanoplasma sp.]